MELNLEGIAVGGAVSAGDWAFHPLVIWCEYPLFSKDLAAVSPVRADLPGFGAVCTWVALYSFGTCGRGFSLEHP